jgi:hypothetical protein
MYCTHSDSIWEAHPSLSALAMAVDDVRCMRSSPDRLAGPTAAVARRLELR